MARLARADVAAVVLVALAHHAYYWWPAGSDARPWVEYIARGAAEAWLWVAVRHRMGSALGLVACWCGAINASSSAACGAAMFGQWGTGDLCVRYMGSGVYAAGAAACVAIIIVSIAWPIRTHRPPQ